MNTTDDVSINVPDDGLILAYSPLVRATAYRYMGRGAEYEDLIQEGYLALMILIPKCRDRVWLPAFLGRRLPGYVRAAAEKMRNGRRHAEVGLEEVEEILSEDDSEVRRSEGEIYDMLSRTLTEEELDLTQALLEGFTQRELAEALGITQQAVSARVRVIRDKLAPMVRGRRG